jgi:hypothetical protein
MSHLKMGLTALAVLIGAGSVVASNAASVNPADPAYTWVTYDQSGNQTGIFTNKTQAEMEDITTCPAGTTNICARAFDSSNQEVTSADLSYQ